MPDTIRCPGCGQENPADRPRCGGCDRPLRPAADEPAAAEPVIFLRRPERRLRPRPALANPLVLWGSVAAVVGVAVIYNVYTGAYRRGPAPIEGATPAQQRAADSLRVVLGRDSTDVSALVALGDVFYDTANWRQAADRYERALALDSSRVRVLVDLGVCRYNDGDAAAAERILQRALRREPGNARALFNLGVLHEVAGDDAGALGFYQRTLAAGAAGPVARAAWQHVQDIRRRAGSASAVSAPRGAPGAGAAAGSPRLAKGRR